MELVPQKKVLDHEVAPVAKEPGQRAEKAEHRDRVADLAGLSFAVPQVRSVAVPIERYAPKPMPVGQRCGTSIGRARPADDGQS